MHLALIIDQERLAQEQFMLNRLCIGLMGESVQLTRIVPDSMPPEQIDSGEQRIALAARIEAPMSVLPWMRRHRVNQIIESLDKSVPDVLYAIGDKAWRLGIDLGGAINRPVVIDVWSLDQARVAPRGGGGGGETSGIAGYIVPCKPISDTLGLRVDPTMIHLVPIGVSLPPEAQQILADPDQSATIAVIGGARDLLAYQALLGGLSRVLMKAPNIQVFLELHGQHEHEIWQLAERLDLLGCISTIGEASQYRSLLIHCDLLLLPERFGEPRSIMLEAMALGMAIVCCTDPVLDMLIDGETARFVAKADPDEWCQRVLALLDVPTVARKMGLKARELVESRHRSSEQVARLLEALGRIVGRGSYPFEGVLP